MKSRVDAILEVVRGPDVLDVGCAGHVPKLGSPYWLHGRLRDRFNVSGIEIAGAAVRELESLGFDRVVIADAHDFHLDERFDTIVAGELIEHLGRPEEFLRTAARHLKPGGRLVLTTPYPFSLLNFLYALKNFPKTCSNAEHTMWFCPSTMHELARRAGLVVQDWALIADYELDTGSRSYRFFVSAIRLLGWLLPRRLRHNAMLFVLVPSPGGGDR